MEGEGVRSPDGGYSLWHEPSDASDDSTRAGQLANFKINAGREVARHLPMGSLAHLVSLCRPHRGRVYIGIDLLFAALYSLGGDCVAGMTPGSFLEAFFFSVQTLAAGRLRSHVPADALRACRDDD